MSDLLGALLPALQTAAGRALRPEDLDLVLVHNTGPIPPVRRRASPKSGEPGFNVVVAEHGRPIYFGKCRPAGDPAIAHEGAVGEVLSRDPAVALHVAATHLARAGAIDVLIVRRLPGRPYHELLEKQSDDEWLSSVERVVGIVEQMATRVAAAMPSLSGTDAIPVVDEAQWALAALQEDGLESERVEALRTCLARGGAVKPRLQHGDLWPPNVLVDGDSWYVIDLELFGRVRLPLYDLFHMLHICSQVRRPANRAGPLWAERVLRGDRSEAGARELVRRTAERQALPAPAAFALLVYYVVDAMARVRARGTWTADWRHYLAEAARLADLIIGGLATPEQLVTSGRA